MRNVAHARDRGGRRRHRAARSRHRRRSCRTSNRRRSRKLRTTRPSAGKSTLTIWWLGNQEIPGIEAWMKDTIAHYEKLHPNVTVKTVLEVD